MAVPLLACLFVLLALGAVERIVRDRCWRAVPLRIHVNGTRGKSTVTRLIWSALRQAGYPAIAKTTGTAARLLLPDGSERPVLRKSPAAIREQLAFLRQARREHAAAAVVECMALEPELQWLSERAMVGATIGVITNVRLDHTEVMGGSLDGIAATLANTIPRSATLVAGDDRFLSLFRERAGRLGTRTISSIEAERDLQARPGPLASAPAWLLENVAVALTVTRELGIDDGVALRGFALAPPDPGAARAGILDVAGRPLYWLDATAANDPGSLEALTLDAARREAAWRGADGPALVVYNHRDDRSPRLACFARHSRVLARAERLVITGRRPPVTVWRKLRQLRERHAVDRAASLEFLAGQGLTDDIRLQRAGATVVFCGNTRGFDLARLLEEVRSDG